jgi:hypothetical protein
MFVYFGHLVYFIVTLVYFPHFGMLYQGKSGKSDLHLKKLILPGVASDLNA